MQIVEVGWGLSLTNGSDRLQLRVTVRSLLLTQARRRCNIDGSIDAIRKFNSRELLTSLHPGPLRKAKLPDLRNQRNYSAAANAKRMDVNG